MRHISAASLHIAIGLFVVYIFFAQWSVSALFVDNPQLSSIFSVFSNIAWILSLIMIGYRIIANLKQYLEYRWFSLFSLALIILLAVASKSPFVVLPVLLGFSAIGLSNRSIAKTVIISLSLLLLASLMLSLSGLTGGDMISKPLFGADGDTVTTATAMGLTNPNVAMMLFLNIVILALYLCKARFIYTVVSAFLFILVIILGVATGSTAGLIIGVAAIVTMFVHKYIAGFRLFMQKITPYMFVLVTLATFAVAVNYGPNRPNAVNDVLTNRPYLWELRVENNSFVNIYGNNDEYEIRREVGTDSEQYLHYPLDNEPLYILVHYGLVVYLSFLFLFYYGSKRLRDSGLLVYVFVVCIAMFVEKVAFYGFVYIFLEKSIAEYYLFSRAKGSVKLKTYTRKELS